MPNQTASYKTNQPVASSLEYNLAQMREIFRMPRNADIITRRITIGGANSKISHGADLKTLRHERISREIPSDSGFSAALLYIDGMSSTQLINLHVLEPIMQAPEYTGDPGGRIEWLVDTILTAAGVKTKDQLDDAVENLLRGDAVLFVDGCASVIIIDAKGFPKRGVERPVNETVVVGPHEAFVENMKDNIALIRRNVRSPALVVEQHSVGTKIKTPCSVLYLDGIANEDMLKELRRRLENLDIDMVITAGELEQLIEDSPYALIPQVIRTERPDRTSSFLISGMAVIFLDGSPIAVGVPATLTHLTHTPELSTMRFPYGAFKRVVIAFGLFITVFLPPLYLALIMFHNEVLPLALITSIYETESRVPIPLLYEFIFLNIGLDLIIEAGARMPGVLAGGLGVVSALILGQAVVAADLVSPLVIIVVAVTGLGSMIVPEYSLSVAIRLIQALLSFLAAVGGLYALLLAVIVLGTELCMMTSMGVPLLWPHATDRMHNPDILNRYPIWHQRIRHYLSNPGELLRSNGRMRAWDRRQEHDDK